ncbi:Receptor y region, transmembrane domain- and RING domain-containing protein 2 [Choanephora cucurbitarum]|uniref:Receptor y region, transmembrane domain-and RING domain-containing protein 2 n=1 Tax=Choanephora cucurbitarum TaxID=101091 RepID=A0A1C7NKF9_9FUNG|nr:Receptor y region, transmembrane domain- and RING domain-containing protein 2 [Choanephora cucurbitarum]
MKRKSIVLFFILFKSSAEAGIFIKAKSAQLIQDTVWLYPNATQTQFDVNVQKVYTKSVIALDHVPLAFLNGTSGILYTREDPCIAIEAAIQLPAIALVENENGNCSTIDRILNAQLEGALGVILYDNTTTDVTRNKGIISSRNNIKIPAYYVNHNTGTELYDELLNIPIFSQNQTSVPAVRITLMPPLNVNPTAWELTLITMIVILGTSLLFSVIMHIYMKKKGRQIHAAVERHRLRGNNNDSPMGKELITLARLESFPTRIIHQVLHNLDSRIADEKKSQVAPAPLNDWKQTLSKKASIAIQMDGKAESETCVICLEFFKINDKVRKLPCQHEYHCICIDPWLTSKSSECPLCKFDCSLEKQQTSKLALLSRLRKWMSPNSHNNEQVAVAPLIISAPAEVTNFHRVLPRAPVVVPPELVAPLALSLGTSTISPSSAILSLSSNLEETEQDGLPSPSHDSVCEYPDVPETVDTMRQSLSSTVQDLYSEEQELSSDEQESSTEEQESFKEKQIDHTNQEEEYQLKEVDRQILESESDQLCRLHTHESLDQEYHTDEVRSHSHYSQCEQYKLYGQYHLYEEHQLYEHYQSYERQLESKKQKQQNECHPARLSQKAQEQLLDELLQELLIQETDQNKPQDQHHSQNQIHLIQSIQDAKSEILGVLEQYDVNSRTSNDSALDAINDAIETATDALTNIDETAIHEHDNISIYDTSETTMYSVDDIDNNTPSNALALTNAIVPTSALNEDNSTPSNHDFSFVAADSESYYESSRTSVSEEFAFNIDAEELHDSDELIEEDTKNQAEIDVDTAENEIVEHIDTTVDDTEEAEYDHSNLDINEYANHSIDTANEIQQSNEEEKNNDIKQPYTTSDTHCVTDFKNEDDAKSLISISSGSVDATVVHPSEIHEEFCGTSNRSYNTKLSIIDTSYSPCTHINLEAETHLLEDGVIESHNGVETADNSIDHSQQNDPTSTEESSSMEHECISSLYMGQLLNINVSSTNLPNTHLEDIIKDF